MCLENRWKRLHVFEKSSFLDLEPSTMIHAHSVSFLTSTDDRIQKYSWIFGFSWTNPSVKSQWYIKKRLLWCGLGSINTIWPCTSSTLQGLFWVFLIRFSLSVSRACLVTCKSAKKWYLMRMCISWLCPFKPCYCTSNGYLGCLLPYMANRGMCRRTERCQSTESRHTRYKRPIIKRYLISTNRNIYPYIIQIRTAGKLSFFDLITGRHNTVLV